MMTKMVSATEFKARSLALIDEMERSGQPLTITRRGKPSLTLTAARAEPAKRRDPFGCMKGTGAVLGDLTEPVDPDWETKWDAKWDERGYPVRSPDQQK